MEVIITDTKLPNSVVKNKHGISGVNIESLSKGKSAEIAALTCSLQIGKEHLGLKAITDVLQDLQYKVSRRRAGSLEYR